MSRTFSLSRTFCTALLLTICFGQNQASAGIFIDLDPATAGIQSNLVIAAGAGTQSVTADVWYDGVGAAGGFNTVGGDVLWTNGGATVAPTSALLAGTLAQGGGVLPLNNQLVAPAGTFPTTGALGTPLNSAALGVPLGFNGSLGGGGYSDINGAFWNGQANGALAAHLLRATFDVTHSGGLVSEFVTFTPGGIIPNGAGTTTAGGWVNGGDIARLTSNNIAGPTISQTFNSATIRVVPEPTSLSLLGLIGLVALRSRRRSV